MKTAIGKLDHLDKNLIKNVTEVTGTRRVPVLKLYIKDSFLDMMTVLLECTCTSYIPGKCTHNVHNFI